MARPKREISAKIIKEMQTLSREWKRFRTSNLLSQKKLAENIEVSRRTIQDIEAGKILPQAGTLAKFERLREIYENEGKPTGKRKSKKTKSEGEF